MTEEQSLPLGAEFEMEMFGVTSYLNNEQIPKYLDFDSSMEDIVRYPPIRDGENGQIEQYDPANPSWGKTAELWEVVRKYLPRYVGKNRETFLYLYVSVGRTSMDYWHGVDAFFWWEGCYVTLDASILQKHKGGRGKYGLKADFVLTPSNTHSKESLSNTGRMIAEFLKRKKVVERTKKKKKRHVGNMLNFRGIGRFNRSQRLYDEYPD